MKRTLLPAWAAAVVLIGGCSVSSGPQPSEPVTLPETFSRSGEIVLQEQWWRLFDDAALNRLVDEALVSNLSLQATWERLAQARAAADKSGAGQYPDLTLSGSASSTDNHGAAKGSSEYYSAALAASYELDLWGRVGSAAEAARLDVEASKEQLHTAQISLSAEVATTWYGLQGQHLHAALLAEQVTLNEKHLALTERKFRSGQANASDVLQQRQSLEAVKGDAILSQKSIELYEHRLAVLLGRTPGSVQYPQLGALPAIRPLPQTGIPSELLMQRPDVKAAYFTLMADDKRLAAAVAERYPRITLSASLESSAFKAADLFDSWLLGLAGNLAAPLLDGGERKAEVARSEAVRNEQLYTYGDTLLSALREVEDALSEVAHQQRYLASLDKQIALSEASVAQIREHYLHGKSSYVSFLNAQLSHQNLQRTRLTALRELIDKRIALYRSLATGWESTRQEPTTRSASHADL